MTDRPNESYSAASADWTPLSDMSVEQITMLKRYQQHLLEINRSVNLVSRSSSENFWTRHIMHSLLLSCRCFSPGSTVVDWGTGGGLPGIPLAIRFPEVEFVLVDSILKKTEALQRAIDHLSLSNVEVWRGRAEQWNGTAHYAVSRATARLAKLWEWTVRVLVPRVPVETPDCWAPGLLCLKGGELTREISELMKRHPGCHVQKLSLEEVWRSDTFAAKYLLSVSQIRA